MSKPSFPVSPRRAALLIASVLAVGAIAALRFSIPANDDIEPDAAQMTLVAEDGAPPAGGGMGGPPMPPAPVMTALAREGAFDLTFRVTGSVEAINSAQLAAEAEGVVGRILVEEGDFVEAGDPLMELRLVPFQIAYDELLAIAESDKARLDELRNGTRPEDLRIAESEFAGAEINLEIAEAEFERFRTLAAQGTVSKSEFDAVRNQFEAARARFFTAQASLERARTGPRQEEIAAAAARAAASQAAAALALDELERASLKAPFSGTIVRRHVSPGSYVRVGDPIYSLESIDKMRVRARVPESQFSLAQVGQEVEMTLDALPGERRTGVVARRIFRAEGNSRSIPILIDVDNEDRRLAPGMLARLVLARGIEGERAVVVPKDAITPQGPEPIIYRVLRPSEGPPTADMVVVRLGRFFGEAVEVFGDIRPGDEVIIRGNERAFPGMPVLPNSFITNPSDVGVNPADFFDETNRPRR